MRVLQIEDDEDTSNSVDLMLKAEGFSVYSTDLGEEGADLARTYEYDAILLDLGLPDMDGLDVLRSLRAAKIATPVLVLTGSGQIEREVASFAAGADDFIRKPFHRDILVARLHAAVRRSRGHAQSLITVGPISVDIDAKQVWVAEEPIDLTGREYQMLELLALRAGTTLTKEMFLNHMYGGLDEPEIKIVDVFICKIRRKLRLHGAAGHIETVWGRGYRLSETPVFQVPVPVAPIARSVHDGKAMITAAVAACEAGASFRDLMRELPRLPQASLRTHISTLLGAGVIENYGGRREARYRLKRAAA